MIDRLPESTQLLYSELCQKIQANPCLHLSGGSFVSKKVKGGTYWYYQLSTPRGKLQRYIGRESDAMLGNIEAAKAAMRHAQPLMEERRRLVAMLAAGGAHIERGRAAKILTGLADAGVFAAGGALVGSFAFACYGNMLGVRMSQALYRTQDMDVSLEREIEVGVTRQLKEDLMQAEPTLSTPRQINPWIVPFNMLAPDGFSIEFLTAKSASADKAPVPIERFGVHAMPLEFMDYLLEDTQPATIVYDAGIPVIVPNPARFALHKLAVSVRRPVGSLAKARKDREQAAALIVVLAEDAPGQLILAAEAAREREDLLAQQIWDGSRQLPEEVANLVGRHCGALKPSTRGKRR